VHSIAVLDDCLHLQKVCLDSGIVVAPSSLASLAIQQFFLFDEKQKIFQHFTETVPTC
jgi:hypothetical protein